MSIDRISYDISADCSAKGDIIKQRFAYPFSFSNLMMKFGHLHSRPIQLSSLSCSLSVSGLRPNEAIMQLYYEVLNDLRKENARDIRSAVDKFDREIQELNDRLDKIEDKYLDGEIDKDDYTRMTNRVKQQMKAIEDRKELLETPNRGKVEPKLKYSMSLIDNIDKFFKYAPAEAKIRALSSIFSGKLEFDGNFFRTDSMNSVLDLIYQQTNELRGRKNKNGESFSTFPASVP